MGNLIDCDKFQSETKNKTVILFSRPPWHRFLCNDHKSPQRCQDENLFVKNLFN